jgi:hypothetical protein
MGFSSDLQHPATRPVAFEILQYAAVSHLGALLGSTTNRRRIRSAPGINAYVRCWQ